MSDAARVLVTGASGFLGAHICRALVARGNRVRAAFFRRDLPVEVRALPADCAEFLRADLTDAAQAREAVQGVDAVIHAAALASDWGPFARFKRHNVDATVHLLDAAESAGCGTFVFISSAVVQGFGVHVDSTEDGPYFPLKYPYQQTKRMAEDLVLARHRPGFRTMAIRPCNVYGPGDRTSTYAMFAAIVDGTFGYIGGGQAYTCPVYIDDLCRGVLAALDRPEAGGEAIILSDGEKVRWRAYVEAMFEAAGSRKRPLNLPAPLAFAAAAVMTAAARAVKSERAPALTMYRVEQAARHYHFSAGKARRVLGFEPRVFYREGLRLTAEAFFAERRERGVPDGR